MYELNTRHKPHISVSSSVKSADSIFLGESAALLVARRTNDQPTIGMLRVRGLLK